MFLIYDELSKLIVIQIPKYSLVCSNNAPHSARGISCLELSNLIMSIYCCGTSGAPPVARMQLALMTF